MSNQEQSLIRKYNKILETQTGTETPRGTLPSLLNTDLKEQKLISMIKADKYLPPINIKSKTVWEDKPSRMWCEKGILDREHGERYHPDRHHGGDNAYERCVEFYKEYDKPEWGKPELGIISGGKKRTRRNRKNKKTRKQRRKSFRRNKK